MGVDGSECSKIALRWAVAEARRRDATLRAVFVPSGSFWYGKGFASPAKVLQEADAQLESAVDEVLDDLVGDAAEVTMDRRVVGGDPREVLTEMSAEADLLVLGARGLGGVAGMMLGSVSRHVSGNAQCPVAVIRQDRQ